MAAPTSSTPKVRMAADLAVVNRDVIGSVSNLIRNVQAQKLDKKDLVIRVSI